MSPSETKTTSAGRRASGVTGGEVLTVGDVPDFAAAGGMIGLRRQGRRMVFDANPEAIRAGGITVSARVLKLARIVTATGSR